MKREARSEKQVSGFSLLASNFSLLPFSRLNTYELAKIVLAHKF
jgi:hypothetical protein